MGDTEMIVVEDGGDIPKCSFTKAGICQLHNIPSVKLSLPSKKWKDRAEDLASGWVTTGITTYSCRMKNIAPTDPNIPNGGLPLDLTQHILWE